MKSMLLPLILAMVSLAVSGCMTCQECGSLKRSNDITRLFLDGEIVSGYTYYYSGPEQRPSAVMAIDSSHTVTAQFWKPVEKSGSQLSEWLRSTLNWKGAGQTNKSGAEILNPDGVQVGIFYSKYDKLVTKFQDNKVIQVYPPSYRAGSGKGIEQNERN